MPGPVGLMRAARAEQVARDRDAADRLTRAYLHTWQQIRSELEHLTALIDDTEKVPVSWLYREQRLTRFKVQVAAKIWQYATFAHQTTRQEVQQAAHDGAKAALDALQATVPDGISYSFEHLSVAAVNKLIAETEKGGRLDKLFSTFAPDAAKRAGDALVQGFTLGESPAQLARRLRDALSIPLSRAMTIARTESLRAYNAANIATYQANSDVCSGWMWLTGADPCPECADVANEIFQFGDDAPPLHPNCFPAGTVVSGPRALASSQRWYSGPLIEVETAGGHFIAVTPNHPILTPQGWVAAGELVEGGYVVCGVSSERPLRGINPYKYQRPALIEDVAVTLTGAGSMAPRSVPVSAEDFHGDGREGQVSIIRTDSHLRDRVDAALSEPRAQLPFSGRCKHPSLLSGHGALAEFVPAPLRAANSGLSGFGVSPSLFGSAGSSHRAVHLSARSAPDASGAQPSCNTTARHSVGVSERLLRLASDVSGDNLSIRQAKLGTLNGAALLPGDTVADGNITEQSALLQRLAQALLTDVEASGYDFRALASDICLDRVLKLRVRSFSGHVYNLQTETGFYLADSIIAHNCRCAASPVTKSWDAILGQTVVDATGEEEDEG